MKKWFVCCFLTSTNSISLSGRYLEFRKRTHMVMASNFVLPENFPSVPYQPLDSVFPKRFYSGNPSSTILLGLNCGIGCTMTRQVANTLHWDKSEA